MSGRRCRTVSTRRTKEGPGTSFGSLRLSSAGCRTALQRSSWNLSRSLAPCSTADEKADARAKFTEEVLEAKPDTPLYALHPFPKTDLQIFENVVEFHARVFADTAIEALPQPERELLEALDSGRVTYEVLRVENWTPTRCGPRKAKRTWFVLRVFSSEDGRELARASVDEVGHVGKLRHKQPSEELEDLQSLEETAAALAAHAPAARRPQYVTTWGTLRCDVLAPCVALQDSDSVYLRDPKDGSFYRARHEAQRLSFKDDLSPESRRGTLQRAGQSGRRIVSLGADMLVEAEPLTARPE